MTRKRNNTKRSRKIIRYRRTYDRVSRYTRKKYGAQSKKARRKRFSLKLQRGGNCEYKAGDIVVIKGLTAPDDQFNEKIGIVEIGGSQCTIKLSDGTKKIFEPENLSSLSLLLFDEIIKKNSNLESIQKILPTNPTLKNQILTTPDPLGDLPIHLALKMKNASQEVISLLLSDNEETKNQILTTPDDEDEGELPIHIALRNTKGPEVISLLLSDNKVTKNQILTTPGSESNLPIHTVFFIRPHPEFTTVIKLLLSDDKATKKKILETSDDLGNLPIHWAILQSVSLEVISLLIPDNISDEDKLRVCYEYPQLPLCKISINENIYKDYGGTQNIVKQYLNLIKLSKDTEESVLYGIKFKDINKTRGNMLPILETASGDPFNWKKDVWGVKILTHFSDFYKDKLSHELFVKLGQGVDASGPSKELYSSIGQEIKGLYMRGLFDTTEQPCVKKLAVNNNNSKPLGTQDNSALIMRIKNVKTKMRRTSDNIGIRYSMGPSKPRAELLDRLKKNILLTTPLTFDFINIKLIKPDIIPDNNFTPLFREKIVNSIAVVIAKFILYDFKRVGSIGSIRFNYVFLFLLASMFTDNNTYFKKDNLQNLPPSLIALVGKEISSLTKVEAKHLLLFYNLCMSMDCKSKEEFDEYGGYNPKYMTMVTDNKGYMNDGLKLFEKYYFGNTTNKTYVISLINKIYELIISQSTDLNFLDNVVIWDLMLNNDTLITRQQLADLIEFVSPTGEDTSALQDKIKQIILDENTTNNELIAFIRYVTGRTSLPSKLTIKFTKDEHPHAHTCFNTVDVPITISHDSIKPQLFTYQGAVFSSAGGGKQINHKTQRKLTKKSIRKSYRKLTKITNKKKRGGGKRRTILSNPKQSC